MLKYLPHLLLLTLLARATLTQSDSCVSCSDITELNFFQLFTTARRPAGFSATPLRGAPITANHEKKEPCYAFSGNQWVKDNGTIFLQNAICRMCSRHEITFHASLLFTGIDLGGPLLEMSHDVSPMFTINVNAKANEIHVLYLHQNKIVVEKFKLKLEIGVWYKLAFQFSGNLLKLFVNCELSEIRLSSIPDYCVDEENIAVIVGGDSKLNYYTGSLEAVRIITSDNPLEKQCPSIASDLVECPICGNHLSTIKKLKTIQENVIELEQQLNSSQNCDNSALTTTAKCEIESVFYEDGAFAKTRDGQICFCQNGEPICRVLAEINVGPTPSSVSTSTKTPTPTGSPAENVADMCDIMNVAGKEISLKVNEKDYTKDGDECRINECEVDVFGSHVYKAEIREQCSPSLYGNCVSQEDKYIRNISICCGHCLACEFIDCPSNSACFNVPPSYICRCNAGFAESGDLCLDIDECTIPSGSSGGHDCPINSSCVNTNGSFKCQCEEFYGIKTDNGEKKCVDLDECEDRTDNCPTNATCINKQFGFDCECSVGFKLDNGICIPVCDLPCKFGKCVATNTCKCDTGYNGSQCDQDINECEISSPCKYIEDGLVTNVTKCHNTPGGYFCTCITGLQLSYDDSGNPKCNSIDECTTGLHLCPKNSKCVNRKIGYDCECSDGNCDKKCILENGARILESGERVFKGCDVCTCLNGDYGCVRKPCNCSLPSERENSCCPECSRTNYCFANGVTLKVGEHQFLPGDSCTFKSCELNKTNSSVFVQRTTTCPTLNCPLSKQYTPTDSCCPLCTLPSCSDSLDGRSLMINKNSDDCEMCTCDVNGSGWSCTGCQNHNCPSLDGCSSKHIAKLTSQDCPVCLTNSEYICTS